MASGEQAPSGIAGSGGIPAGVLYGITMFLSAFLLFQVQPIISRFILPWYGGAASVWTVCMLFFQVFLLLGYAYAYVLTRMFSARAQVLIHVLVLLSSLVLLPIVPGDSWKPGPADEPLLGILSMLTVCLGLPFFALSATSPLLQRWFVIVRPGVSPYRFYALSNVGSLLALLSYPFIVEPVLSRRVQAAAWSWGMVAFVVLCSVCLWYFFASSPRGGSKPRRERDTSPRSGRLWLWVALPAASSFLLLATTNKICQEITVLPLFWVVPLALYLLSFVISFDRPRWYSRRIFGGAFIVSIGALGWVLWKGWEGPVAGILLVYPAVVFTASMICHGELARLQPPARRLTLYYLAIASGGALGSLLVALAAPLVFDDYSEFYVGIFAAIALFLAVLFTDARSGLRGGRPRWAWSAIILGVGLFAALCVQARNHLRENAILTERNFYGTLAIVEYDDGDPNHSYRSMRHGGILHGLQFTAEKYRIYPTTYFGPKSGVGKIFQYYPREKPLRVGLIGLGIGTLAAWAVSGDIFRFYEINPDVKRLAEEYFSYLVNCRAHKEYVMGDARLSLEHESPQEYDILVVDAFNTDSPPLHLLTEEAFNLYRRHLKPGGVLAMHITCRHIDFFPVLANLAEHLGMRYRLIVDGNENRDQFANPSRWMLLSDSSGGVLDHPAVVKFSVRTSVDPAIGYWTDDYSSILPLLVW